MPDETTGTRNATVACVDASFVVRVLDAPRYPTAYRTWERLVGEGCELIAPTLLPYEVCNALHQQQRGQLVTSQTAADGLWRVLKLPLELHGDARLHERAFELAVEHTLPAAYDAHYLALAERFRAPLWTGDRRLAEAVRGDGLDVHLVP